MNAPVSYLNKDESEKFYAAGHWRDETFYTLIARHAARSPDRFAVRETSLRLSYAQFLDRVDALADELVRQGLQSGDSVVTWIPNRIELLVIHIACSRGGYVFCPSPDRNHTVADVTKLLQRVQAKAFFYQPRFGADADKTDIVTALKNVSSLHSVFKVEAVDGDRGVPFAGMKALDASSRNPAWIDNDPDKVRYLSFTSGSTGIPKGVMHSDNTLIAIQRAMAIDWRFDSSTVTYALSPISHGLGISGWLSSLLVGGEFVLNDLPRGASIVGRMIETEANYLVGVPTHAIDVLNELRSRGSAAGLEKLKCFRVSGAATPRAVIQEMLEFGIPLQSGYGMTENCAHQYTRPQDPPEKIMNTCGKVCAGYEVQIFDADNPDTPVKPGDIGQVGGKGASLMLGYFEDEAASKACLNSGNWFMTGDLGHHDDNGYLHITGRMKDMIIRGGHNINPGRIEDFVMQHEAIERVAVFSIPDERLGERICLAVMFRPGKVASAAEILKQIAKAGLSRYEMPEYFIALPEIPVMPNGKVRKLDIMQRVRNGEITPKPVTENGG